VTKFEKIYVEIFFVFIDEKMQFTYPQPSIKDVQATEEAISPQKSTSSTSKHKIS
jgi:hypothetical protein